MFQVICKIYQLFFNAKSSHKPVTAKNKQMGWKITLSSCSGGKY